VKRVITAVVIVGLTVGWFVTRADGATPNYRTAVAKTKTVSQTLDEVGTVEPVSAASVAFPVAGRVATVQVSPGATVTRGQVLATLDTTELDNAVDAAQADLDQAKLTLANAIAANAEEAQPEDTSELDQARQAVLDGQRLVDEKIGAGQAALESANEVCAAVTEESVSACQSALNDVLQAQAATAEAQSALSAASNALEQLRNQSQPDDRSSGPATSGGTASAADLRQYQKDIDAKAAAVAVAKQNVAAATIVSPIEGTIEDVDLEAGDSVTAGSTTKTVRVVGPSGYEVTAIVSVDDLKDVKLGQQAVVTPDGTRKEITGEVVAIGAPRASNGATTYPVTIGVDDDSALRNGTVAGVAITTGEASSGVAVPTSAVHVEGTRKTVTLLRNGKVDEASVTVGVIGRQWTQITRGIKAGDEVVLADVSQPLPSDATSSSNGNSRRDRVFGGDGGPVVEIAPGGGANGPPAGFKVGP
jgi:HlyD family secretion protein